MSILKQNERTGHDIFQETVEQLSRLAGEIEDRDQVVENRLRELEAEKKALANARQITSAVAKV